jgi:phosphoenolpyruvate-protein phosphotransferase/dihydroxyacetone kinase phosphotransfer subunit
MAGTVRSEAVGAEGAASTVGLVVVSHSRALAEAAVSLAGEMVHRRTVRIAVAAGLDATTFGTDAVRIKEAIEAVDGPAGVVVLMDLGSAVLSAELALDLLDDTDVRDRVLLSPAPIVEGLIVAAVAAAGGATREDVAAEAREALLGKAAHLGVATTSPPLPASQPDTPGSATDAQRTVVRTFTVTNRHGLHARPAARLVNEVRTLDARVSLRNLTTAKQSVPADSLSRVAMLGALQGHEIEVTATGPQAREAVEHVAALAARNFDEPADHSPGDQKLGAPSEPPRNGALPGSPGIAFGPLRRLRRLPVLADAEVAGSPANEWRRIVGALAAVRRDIDRVRTATAKNVGPEEASIFDAHLALLADATMLAEVRRRISDGAAATTAWRGAVEEVQHEWEALPDPYLRARAEDVAAVGDQVLRVLTGTSSGWTVGEGILVARDLTPADAAEIDPTTVRGIVLATGSPTSHAAILARSRGIPAVVAAGSMVLDLAEGTSLLLDGSSGELYVDPSPDTVEIFESRAARLLERATEDAANAGRPAVTRDGHAVEIGANIGSSADAAAARANGADSVGLVRTEFLFLGRDSAPTRDEQRAAYRAIAAPMEGRRVTFRTLDIGGDKPVTYLDLPKEDNPFLGHRGIRLTLDRRDLLTDQLEALCAVAHEAPIDVMFPMITTVSELIDARQVLAAAAPPETLRVGMMVEVPATALKLETFLPHLDFVSIGTNDLTQYTLAAERGNPAVAALSDALDPGVLLLINAVCRVAHGRVHVAVCGEAAADEAAIPILVGLGVDELSVAPSAVPAVKRIVRGLDSGACRALAEKALTLSDAGEVRGLARASGHSTD